VLAGGDLEKLKPVERLDSGGSSIAGDPQVDLAETGAAVAAWRELRGSAGLISVQERRSDGVVEPATLSAPRGGAVGSLRLGGSGLGDAIVAWTQGSGANAQVAAAVVDAPPDPFFVQTPEGWRSQGKVTIHWAAAVNAIGSLTYSVSVDDEPTGKPTKRLFARLHSGRIGDGRHRIQVFAIDEAGQETGSRNAVLLVDRKPPEVRLKQRGRHLVVTISDGARRETSGLKGGARVSFGDGERGRSVRHTYSRPGSYRVTVTARDRAGNRTSFERKVRIG
jgi:PKD domain-containing protein